MCPAWAESHLCRSKLSRATPEPQAGSSALAAITCIVIDRWVAATEPQARRTTRNEPAAAESAPGKARVWCGARKWIDDWQTWSIWGSHGGVPAVTRRSDLTQLSSHGAKRRRCDIPRVGYQRGSAGNGNTASRGAGSRSPSLALQVVPRTPVVMEGPPKSGESRVVATEDHTPAGFRWLQARARDACMRGPGQRRYARLRRHIAAQHEKSQTMTCTAPSQLKKLRWVDPKGTERQWECASRSTRRGDVDGVAVFGRLRRKGHEDCVVRGCGRSLGQPCMLAHFHALGRCRGSWQATAGPE